VAIVVGDKVFIEELGICLVEECVNFKYIIVKRVEDNRHCVVTGYEIRAQRLSIPVPKTEKPIPIPKNIISIYRGVLRRCCPKFTAQHRLTLCYLADDFRTLRGFSSWYASQPFCNFTDENGNVYEIDKDMKVIGNRTYGKDYCSLIPIEINGFLKRHKIREDCCYTGVTRTQNLKLPWRACINNKHFGVKKSKSFSDKESAHLWYKEEKRALGKLVADYWEGRVEVHILDCLRNIPDEAFILRT